ncbi:signal peptidase II [Autumnicola edwardsiae]|uniref:Lipoprotein signal peptidase n=1 Tax=Autumnicola edwardsiae TaxID=3075594 RepID=A0ABU3CY16_9FLAO|nr:signal peptidase II [Zunongwangia sp. F297]MDT0651211.1 signal peptidase II [Zunongwangia sp. F297]
MKAKRLTKLLIGLILIISNVSCDQITKKEARRNIDAHERIEVVNDTFVLTNVENTGAALEFGSKFHPTLKLFIFQLLPTLVLIYLFYLLFKEEDISKLNFVAITFFIGGGIGNILDRVLRESVTDFMYLELGPVHTGIFNMADVSITLGAILFITSSIISKEKKSLKANV